MNGGFDESNRSKVIESILSEGWVRQIEWLNEVDSTNDFLKNQLTADPESKTPWLVVADEQSGGRGRGDRKWWSPQGCLMFSLGWRPTTKSFAIERPWSQLSLVVGLAVAKAIEPYLMSQFKAKVKWPNDVYVNNKKIAGILIEHIVGTGSPVWVIGIGINVEVPFEDAPSDISLHAESLHRVVSNVHATRMTKEFVLAEIIAAIETTLSDWMDQPEYLTREWPPQCLLTGEWIEVDSGSSRIGGVCQGIGRDGALLVRDDNGICHALRSGSITIRV